MFVPAPHRFRRWVVLAACTLLAACSVTPVPEPPTANPKKPDLATIDGHVENGIFKTPITLTGAPGSLEPDARLWVVNLDTQDPSVEINPDADGGFQVLLPEGSVGQELRLQARKDDRRSDPVDAMIVAVSGKLAASTRNPCLTFTPPLELAFGQVPTTGGTKSIEIASDCAGDVTIDNAVLRVANPEFALPTALPLVIAPSKSSSFDATLVPAGAGLREEVLLLRIASPFVERRPITLYGFGSP